MFDIDPKAVESVARSPFSAGFIGGVILILKGGTAMTWWVRLSTVAAAILVAGVFGPAASGFFRIESEEMRFGFAALIGIFGFDLAKALFDAFTMWVKNFDFSTIIPFLKGGAKGKGDE